MNLLILGLFVTIGYAQTMVDDEFLAGVAQAENELVEIERRNVKLVLVWAQKTVAAIKMGTELPRAMVGPVLSPEKFDVLQKELCGLGFVLVKPNVCHKMCIRRATENEQKDRCLSAYSAFQSLYYENSACYGDLCDISFWLGI